MKLSMFAKGAELELTQCVMKGFLTAYQINMWPGHNGSCKTCSLETSALSV